LGLRHEGSTRMNRSLWWRVKRLVPIAINVSPSFGVLDRCRIFFQGPCIVSPFNRKECAALPKSSPVVSSSSSYSFWFFISLTGRRAMLSRLEIGVGRGSVTYASSRWECASLRRPSWENCQYAS
jgi:hypothetical protein